MVKVVIKILSR